MEDLEDVCVDQTDKVGTLSSLICFTRSDLALLSLARMLPFVTTKGDSQHFPAVADLFLETGTYRSWHAFFFYSLALVVPRMIPILVLGG